MNGRARMRLCLGAGTAIVLAATPPAPAMTMKVRESTSTDAAFAGDGCGAVDAAEVWAPARAYGLRTWGLHAGDELESAWDFDTVATAQSVRVRREGSRPVVRWTVVGSGAACEPDPDAVECELFEEDCASVPSSTPWETEDVTLGIGYLRRRTVPALSLGALRSDARLTLSIRFGAAYDHGYAHALRCRRLGRYRGRCRFSWIIGDGVYRGSFVSTRVVVRRPGFRSDATKIRNRGAARVIDEYCQVTGGSGCVRRVRIRFG